MCGGRAGGVGSARQRPAILHRDKVIDAARRDPSRNGAMLVRYSPLGPIVAAQAKAAKPSQQASSSESSRKLVDSSREGRRPFLLHGSTSSQPTASKICAAGW